MAVTPMRAGAIKPQVDRTGRESTAYQYIREALVNAGEAGATHVVIRPEWGGVETDDVYRLLIFDDGRGMDGETELKRFMNTFGGGGKPIGDMHENFGMGVKTSLLPWNHAGIIMASRVGGRAYLVRLEYDAVADEYGLHRWEYEDDDELAPPRDDDILRLDVQDDEFDIGHGVTAGRIKEALPPHGTVLVLLGMTGAEDTLLARGAAGQIDIADELDLKGISKYLNRRFFNLPCQVHVHEPPNRDKRTWPKSGRDAYTPRERDPKFNRREIKGARYYLEEEKYACPEKGSCPLPDGSVVHWYLWHADQERPRCRGFAEELGFIGVLYDNELYQTSHHAARYRMFGVIYPEVRRRLTLVIEPPVHDAAVGVDGVYPHGSRSQLAWSGANELPWAEWGTGFQDVLPDEIMRALRRLDSPAQDPDSGDWMNNIYARFEQRFRRMRFALKADGGHRAEFTDAAGPGVGGGGELGEKGDGDRKARNRSGGGKGDRTRAKREKANGDPATPIEVREGLPQFQWVEEAVTGEPGRAAVYLDRSPAHDNRSILLVNREFWAFQELFDNWISRYPDYHAEVVRQTIELVYGTDLCTKVAHAQNLRGRAEWSPDQVNNLLLSPEALTLAALGLYACDYPIQTMLTNRLGKARVEDVDPDLRAAQ